MSTAQVVDFTGKSTAEDELLTICTTILNAGGVAAFPTDTVWGLGALASANAAIDRIYDLKGRAEQQPLACLVPSLAEARKWVSAWPDPVAVLAERHWPGPLTLVLPTNGLIFPSVQRGSAKIGLRVPDHGLLRALLERLNAPLAATSANRSGQPELSSMTAVSAEMGSKIDLIVNGEASLSGRASTVLEWTGLELKVLRQGEVRC